MKINQAQFNIEITQVPKNSSFTKCELYKFLVRNGFNPNQINRQNSLFHFKRTLIKWPACIIPINFNEFFITLDILTYSLSTIYLNTHNEIIKILPFLKLENSPIISLDANEYFNFYNINLKKDFISLNQKILKSREFNTLDIQDGWVIKKSPQKKIYHEYTFLKSQQLNGNKLYPKVCDFEELNGKFSYKVEHIKMIDSSVLLTNNLLVGDIFVKFRDNIADYFDATTLNAIRPDDREKKKFVQNYKSRIQKIFKNPQIDIYIKFLSTLLECDLRKEIKLFTKNYIDIIRKGEIGKYSTIHGDLCLSNILFDYSKNQIKLIDPKGLKIRYPVAYDIAKLSHSLLGNYDFIVNNLNVLNVNKINDGEEAINHEYEEFIKNLSKKINVNFKTIRTIEASLFLTMIPLHLESKMRVFNFLCNFYKINQTLKEL